MFLLIQINLSGLDDSLVFTTTTTTTTDSGSNQKPGEVDLLSDLDVLGAAGGVPKHAYTHPARQEAEREEQEEREQSAAAVRLVVVVFVTAVVVATVVVDDAG